MFLFTGAGMKKKYLFSIGVGFIVGGILFFLF